ncbi:MAG TPA: AAA family ATPase, partial [Flavobacterium sp.]
MKITKISVKNFRLLDAISINIENDITLIIGKNNSGKTSLFEVINLFFDNKNKLTFHDFSLNSHDVFKMCYDVYQTKLLVEKEEDRINKIEEALIRKIPRITLSIQIEYD